MVGPVYLVLNGTAVMQDLRDTKELDEQWMLKALELARRAESLGEVPVGAILVRDNKLIGQGYNQPILANDPSAHAEMIAVRDAARQVENYRLPGSILYVTLEPCSMCVGVIVHARIKRLVFAAYDRKTGVVESCYPLLSASFHNHKIMVSGGILEKQSSELLSAFFKKVRKRKNK